MLSIELEIKTNYRGKVRTSQARVTSQFYHHKFIIAVISLQYNEYIIAAESLQLYHRIFTISFIAVIFCIYAHTKYIIKSGYCSIRFFQIVNLIQIHCKFMIDNPNPNPSFSSPKGLLFNPNFFNTVNKKWLGFEKLLCN